MNRLKRVEQLEAAVRNRRARDSALFELTLGSMKGTAQALLEEAGRPVPISLNGCVLEPQEGEGAEAFEARVLSAVLKTVEAEALPLDLAGFYRLLPCHEGQKN